MPSGTLSRTLDELPLISSLIGGEVFHVRRGGIDYKLTGDAITGGALFLTTGVADGRYYSALNPSGYITSSYLSSYASISSLEATGSSLQSSINSLASQTGSYYPRSNPSGFITSSQTGSLTGTFVSRSETGAFGGLTTGQADARYYPLTANPSGYIPSGVFSSTGQLINSYITDLKGATYRNAEFWDGFDTNTGLLDNRVSDCGKIWENSIWTGKAIVTGGQLSMRSGTEEDTVYLSIVHSGRVGNIGGKVRWSSHTGNSSFSAGVFLIAEGFDFFNDATFHCTFNRYGASLAWCPNGIYQSGHIETTLGFNPILELNTDYVFQVYYESGMAVMQTPAGNMVLTGVTGVPERITRGIWEFSTSPSPMDKMAFLEVWSNSNNVVMPGQTVQGWSKKLDNLNAGYELLLNNQYKWDVNGRMRAKEIIVEPGTVQSGYEGGIRFLNTSSGDTSFFRINQSTNNLELALPTNGGGLTVWEGTRAFGYIPVFTIGNWGKIYNFDGLDINGNGLDVITADGFTNVLNGNWLTETMPTATGHVVNKRYVDTVTGSLTGIFITLAQSGQFYSSNNPSGYITSSSLSSYATVADLAATGSTLQSSINALQAATGQYYPYSNPSGYVSSSQTGSLTGQFVSRSETGAFGGSGGGMTTGEADARYYPLSTNPSGYVTSSATGSLTTQFVSRSETGAFAPIGYTLFFTHGTTNPADGATVYFGAIGDLAATTTSGNSPKVYIPRAGRIKNYYGGCIVGSTIGSSETANVILQVNGISVATGSMIYSNANRWNDLAVTGLNIAVNAGDALNFIQVCPTWTTNPTAIRHSINVYVE